MQYVYNVLNKNNGKRNTGLNTMKMIVLKDITKKNGFLNIKKS